MRQDWHDNGREEKKGDGPSRARGRNLGLRLGRVCVLWILYRRVDTLNTYRCRDCGGNFSTENIYPARICPICLSVRYAQWGPQSRDIAVPDCIESMTVTISEAAPETTRSHYPDPLETASVAVPTSDKPDRRTPDPPLPDRPSLAAPEFRKIIIKRR